MNSQLNGTTLFCQAVKLRLESAENMKTRCVVSIAYPGFIGPRLVGLRLHVVDELLLVCGLVLNRSPHRGDSNS
jgi:hypothetical protein